MALAVRRLVLRSKCFHYRRPTTRLPRAPSISPLRSAFQRQFHATSFRQENKNEHIQADFQQLLANIQKEQGRELNDSEKVALADDYVQALVDAGETEKALDVLMSMNASRDQINDVRNMIADEAKLEAEGAKYEELLSALEAAGNDQGALENILKASDIDPSKIESGEFQKSTVQQLLQDPELQNAQNEDEFERLVWEKYQKASGMSVAEIANARKEDAEEMALLELGIHEESRGESVSQLVKDQGLYREIVDEQNLDPLWRRLGGADAQGNIVRKDLLKFLKLAQLVGPRERQILEDHLKGDEAEAAEKTMSKVFPADDIDDPEDMPKKREAPGFWNYEDDEDMGEDEVFQQDDLPRSGHQELELKREIREYGRWMVWELPLLSKLRKPYKAPTSEQVLRFRYTTYLGEQHPAEKKVVVEFSPDQLDLTQVQKSKLIKVAGSRYNPSTGIFKASCESFETAAQNKRYLGDLVEILIKEAQDPKDTFEDVPFDFRHHTPKVFHAFPEHWKLTPERQAELLARRQEEHLLEQVRADTKPLLDGKLFIPGGAEAREQAAARTRQIAKEKLLDVDDADSTVTEREREALVYMRETRTAKERADLIADMKARRPTKRDAKTRKLVAQRNKRLATESYMRPTPNLLPLDDMGVMTEEVSQS